MENRQLLASMFDIQWLGHVGSGDNFSSAQGINDQGQVVGNSWVQDNTGIPAQEKAFSWTPNGGMVDLGTLNGNASYAWDVNNNGLVSGWYHFPVSAPGTTAGGGYYEWAALWNGGVATTIPGHDQIGGHSVAYDANDSNVVVGHADVAGGAGRSEAFAYDGTTFTFLGTLGGQWSYGMDINNGGMIAGFADTGENPSTDPGVYMSRYHAVLWSSDGVIHDLGTLGADSYAYEVNDLGMAVGSSIGADGFYHPFLYDGTAMIDIGGLGSHGEALSINNQGQVVGDAGSWLNSTAFLYENGTVFDLNTLVNAPAGQTADTLMRATDINNLGQIVGYGLHNGSYEAFLLTPNGLTPPTVPPVTPPANSAPTADAGGPYAITEGSGLTLDATRSSDPDGDVLSYSWDVNGDGSFGDATGANPTLTAAQLKALGVTPGAYAVGLQVDDGQGHVAAATAALTVSPAPTDVPPTASVSGPADGYEGVSGQTRTLVVEADDPAGNTEFEFSIDWGDGQDESFYGLSGDAVSHVYDAPGEYTVTVTATNDQSLTSDPAATVLNILQAEQQDAITAIGGSPGDDTFVLQAGAAAGTIITSAGSFTTGQVMVYGHDGDDHIVVQGTAGNDSLGINAEAVAIGGVVLQGDSVEHWTADGQAGSDTFYLNAEGLPIDLQGGDGSDRFKFSSWGAVSGRVDGGAGSDILDYGLHHRPATVNLQLATASDTGGFANMEGFVGSNLFDTLIGADTLNAWAMNGYNAGKVNAVQFSSFEQWVGGAANDSFKLANSRYISGTIDGGEGINTLDYSSFVNGVGVNLAAGTATGVRLGIANIANVTGGSGSDTIVGNAGDNVLLGNAGNDQLLGGVGGNDVLVGGVGNDSLTGSAGRNLLIGGLGVDILRGGSDEDLLIGGNTTHDTNVKSLQSLMAEWKRTDQTYQQRIDHLMGTLGGGANGSIYLRSSTVKDDGAADPLTGSDALDWFWGLAGEAADRTAGERLN